MKVYLSSDHAGFDAKQLLLNSLSSEYRVIDLGPERLDPHDDYPLFAKKLAQKIASEKGSKGILTCGSGEGMAIAANKIKGVRASVVWNEKIAKETREDNDSNILSLPAQHLTNEKMIAISRTWLKTNFSNLDRHIRRLKQIEELENNG